MPGPQLRLLWLPYRLHRLPYGFLDYIADCFDNIYYSFDYIFDCLNCTIISYGYSSTTLYLRLPQLQSNCIHFVSGYYDYTSGCFSCTSV
jgi:hypothetical protein